MTVKELIIELSQLPKDYEVSICGVEDFAYAIDNNLKVVLIDEETPIDEYCDDHKSEYTHFYPVSCRTCKYGKFHKGENGCNYIECSNGGFESLNELEIYNKCSNYISIFDLNQ